MNLVQQTGDLELINLLQGTSNQNIYNQQNLFNITVLIPQQTTIQQLGSSQELSMVNNHRKRICRMLEKIHKNIFSSVSPCSNFKTALRL